MPTLALILLSLAMFQERRPEAALDEVHLKDGEVLAGQVAYEDMERLLLRVKSKETWIPNETVEHVDSRVRSLDELLDRLDDLGGPGRRPVDGLLELSRFAEHSLLPGEAQVLAAMALVADPYSTDAGEAARGRLRRERWELEFDDRWHRLDELLEEERPWKERVSIDTAHFRLVTNLDLGQALDAAIDLERQHRAFYDLFATEFTLLDPSEIMEVHLHTDEKSFPEPGSGRDSSFAPGDRIARALVDRPPWRRRVTHEVTRQLLFYTTRRAINAKGHVPPWIDAGLSEAMAQGITGPLGASRYDPATRNISRYRLQARHDRALSIDRVVVLSQLDFEAEQRQDLKYAQCYTLVQFMLYGGDPHLRESLLETIRDAYAGKSGPTQLKRNLEPDLDDVGEVWEAHVQAVAGT